MRFRYILTAIFLLLGTLSSQAHDPGLSSAKLALQNGQLHATLTFAPADVEAIANGEKPDPTQLQALARQSLEVWVDGQKILPTEAKSQLLPNHDVEFQLSFPAPAAAGRIRIRSAFLDRLPFGHRQYLDMTAANGATLSEKLLSGSNPEIEAPLVADITQSAAPQSHPFSEFLVMGIKHILTGYDHMLFLFAVLIGCRQISSVVKIITAFTIGHSISLALATLGWVEIPSRIIEPLIAATIVYVGIENLVSRQAVSHRAFLTFGFGLVHGFGFASALRDMGVGINGSAVALPLVGFNSGVEIGQMMVAAVILPVIWHFKDRPQFTLRWAPACSAVVALAGSFWFIQRVWPY